jgi:hypothetical protein
MSGDTPLPQAGRFGRDWPHDDGSSPGLRCAAVLRVGEDSCEVWVGNQVVRMMFAPTFPTPRAERVLPGHLVAVATAPAGHSVIVWRWFDAVVLGPDRPGLIRLWEPAHGEVVAQMRDPAQHLEPGSRVYASSGLPGADWWAAGPITPSPEGADVELQGGRHRPQRARSMGVRVRLLIPSAFVERPFQSFWCGTAAVPVDRRLTRASGRRIEGQRADARNSPTALGTARCSGCRS